MTNDRLQNMGNADIVIEKSSHSIKLPMIKLESIFDFYSEEPPSISIQTKKINKSINYEQVLRIRKWNVKKTCFSWCIYSSDREEFKDIVIRRVEWDIEKDKESVKANVKKTPSSRIKWPAITTYNYFIPVDQAKDIIGAINGFDKLIRTGVVLEHNENPSWEWRDLEVKRLYDWGQIHNTWSTNMKNQVLENMIDMLQNILDTCIEDVECKIHSIVLNYSVLPQNYIKEIIESEE